MSVPCLDLDRQRRGGNQPSAGLTDADQPHQLRPAAADHATNVTSGVANSKRVDVLQPAHWCYPVEAALRGFGAFRSGRASGHAWFAGWVGWLNPPSVQSGTHRVLRRSLGSWRGLIFRRDARNVCSGCARNGWVQSSDEVCTHGVLRASVDAAGVEHVAKHAHHVNQERPGRRARTHPLTTPPPASPRAPAARPASSYRRIRPAAGVARRGGCRHAPRRPRRLRPRPRPLPRRGLPGDLRGEDGDRFGHPADLEVAAVLGLEGVGDLSPGLAGDQDVVAGLAGERLDPGGDVDRAADDREVESAGAADGAGDYPACVDADADPQLARLPLAVDRPADLQAARTARSAWSANGSGAPNTASRPSPSNLSTCPPWRAMIGTTTSNRPFSAATTSAGVARRRRR